MDRIGLDAAGRESLSHSLFTLEAHIHYLREVKLGAALEVRAQVVAIDAKRLHVALALHVPGVDGAACDKNAELYCLLAGARAQEQWPCNWTVARRAEPIQRIAIGWLSRVKHDMRVVDLSSRSEPAPAAPSGGVQRLGSRWRMEMRRQRRQASSAHISSEGPSPWANA